MFNSSRNAKRIKNINGMTQILLDLKPRRSLGELYLNEKVDVTNLVEYINKYKNKKDQKITFFHAFTMAMAKTIYNRPKLNYFVQNHHMFEHNDVVLSFVAKVAFNDKSSEMMILLPVSENDNIFTISEKITNKLNDIRAKKELKKEGANNIIDILGKLPNIIRIPIVGIIKKLDKHGLLPSSIVKDNLYYSSMIISNIGTLHCDAIYHNVTDFGTCSGLTTIGEIKEEIVDGKKKCYCDFGITIDERIADGFYFIKSIKLLEYILNNPKLLEENANEKVEIEFDK